MLSFHPLCKSGLNFGRISRKLGTSGQRQLFKKFLFHVHPDFFHNEKSLQHINATNLSILQGIIDKTSPIDTAEIKSLTFYLKPELVGSTAQKVRVSTTRIEKSITEILETIGVEIPSESENDSNLFRSSHSTVMASADQTMEFLNSMFERKALMALREIRSTELKQLEKALLGLTGAQSVVYRNSWSAQNNALLLSKLIHLIQQNRKYIELPWTGMSIVYSKEDSEQPVNYLNREIVLNPADVPEQLLAVLLTVRVSALAESQVHLNQVAQLQEAFEKVAMSILQGSVQGSTLDAPGDHKHGRLFTSDIVLSAHRGFTCTMTNFYYFLYTMNEKRLLPNQEELPQLQQDSGSLTSGNSASSNNSNSSSALKQSPLRVRITVEDTHGTKVLEDGSFRVDVRADRDEVYTLLRHGAKGIQEHVQQHRRMQQEINILSAEAVAELNLISITPAVGVSEEQLLEFLRRFTAYMKQSRVTKHALQQLHGLKVVAGHYLGVTDNGACVLPWELSLPEPIDSY